MVNFVQSPKFQDRRLESDGTMCSENHLNETRYLYKRQCIQVHDSYVNSCCSIEFDRRRSVGRLEAGQSVISVAAAMGVSKSVIWLLEKATEGANALQKHAEGRGRNTTPLEDHYVALVTKKNRSFSPSQIAANLVTAIGIHVSAKAISRRLN
ncbi:hypothetical protein TNCV_1257761 [Trichonephila clavipes]|nr:hypothetical protein TNCV_1257761 [Trichonephila clavipes]